MVTKDHGFRHVLTAEEAVDGLQAIYVRARDDLKSAVELYLNGGPIPSPDARRHFTYPELRLTYAPDGLVPTNARAFAKFSMPLRSFC